MTINSAQQQARQTRSTQDEREQQVAADIQIPVLIRLPDVSDLVGTEQAASNAHIVWQDSFVPQDSTSVTEESRTEPTSESSQPTENLANSETAGSASLEPAKAEEHSFWSDFSLPSSVVHAAVALSLVGVFIVAYMLIVGGGGDTSEVAASKPAADDATLRHAHTEGELAESSVDVMMPKIPEMPLAPLASEQAAAAPAEEPLAEPAETPVAERFAEQATTPASEWNKQQLANQETTAREQTAIPSTPEATQPEQTNLATQAGAASIQQTEFNSPADPPVTQTNQSADSKRSAVIENPWAAGFSNEVPQENTASEATTRGGFYNSPLTSHPSSSETNESANTPRYPATNPVSFQYPANYHEHLLGTNSQEASRPTPWSDEANVYSQQPATARMQPRMDAPPIR